MAAVVVLTVLAGACGGGASPNAVEEGGGTGGGSVYSASVTWTQPTLNTDGSSLSDAVGYRIDYGNSPSNLALSVSVTGATNTSTTVAGLSAGTYYFAVTTLNAAGAASNRSDVVSKTVP